MADSSHLTDSKKAEQAARDVRLAKALRDNLARRKEQSRARQTEKKQAGADKPPA